MIAMKKIRRVKSLNFRNQNHTLAMTENERKNLKSYTKFYSQRH